MPDNDSTFYLTTPIYYVNDKPHIGHAYTTILADVLARYHRLLDLPTFFLTGTDEHGQKVAEAAKKNGVTPQEHADRTVVRFQELWQKLEITNDDFIRTTEDRHKTVVSRILQDLYDRDEIYKADYEGSYCIHCERFFMEKDLLDNCCPEAGCGRPIERLVEANYFFRMSKYQQWLIDTINADPALIQPDFRRNETLGFLRNPLEDLCISRPKSRLSWGIELPFDSDYVCYVWFDALVNYISTIGYLSDDAGFQKWWPANFHLIGKDILTTHTVYWPTMLQAIGLPLPATIFAHGWWLIGESKMGKSQGNVVDPMQMCDDYGIDAFRYYLLAEMTLGRDAAFSESGFIKRYNTDLADSLGNMLNRVVKLIVPNFDGTVPTPGHCEAVDEALKSETLAAVNAMESDIRTMKLNRGLERVMGVVRACNRYFEQTTPWTLVRDGNTERLATVLYTAAESLRIVSGLLYPVIPGKMTEMRRALGIPEDRIQPNLDQLKVWGVLQSGCAVADIIALFPRIEISKDTAVTAATDNTAKSGENAMEPDNVVDLVDIQALARIELRTARILVAEKVEGADRLLRMDIEVGEDKRQIVAGIAQHYEPESLVGRLIVVVSNLKPAKIRGLTSNGMLLAAKSGDKLRLISVDGDIASGVEVS